MPSSTSGFSGSEIVSYAQNFIGNESASFQSFLEQTLALAEFRFCKLHDWSFLNKQNLSLTVASGTDNYSLTVATLGYYMKSTDIKRIYSVANNRYLKKVTLDELRLIDTDQNDGTSASELQYWAPCGDNEIIVWPKTFEDTTLKVDGKVTPTALLTMANYPTVPYAYQDSFMAYYLGLCLERENDDRAERKMASAMALIQQDIANDSGHLANSGQPRFRSLFEAPEVTQDVQYDPLNMLRPG
jgi:hypothetical protein